MPQRCGGVFVYVGVWQGFYLVACWAPGTGTGIRDGWGGTGISIKYFYLVGDGAKLEGKT